MVPGTVLPVLAATGGFRPDDGGGEKTSDKEGGFDPGRGGLEAVMPDTAPEAGEDPLSPS